jgi:hypothetical protein
LLNPDIPTDQERRRKHETWFTDITGSAAFLTEHTRLVEDENFASKTVEELGLKAPCVLQFVPTRKIFAALIKRATQINDPILDLNPYE